MMGLEEIVLDIFDQAKSKGLEDLEIRIKLDDSNQSPVSLFVKGKDRFGCTSLSQLEQAVSEHKNGSLTWMNK